MVDKLGREIASQWRRSPHLSIATRMVACPIPTPRRRCWSNCSNACKAAIAQARDELVRAFQTRLEHLAGKMLRQYPGVGRWVEVEDVLQGSLLRLLARPGVGPARLDPRLLRPGRRADAPRVTGSGAALLRAAGPRREPRQRGSRPGASRPGLRTAGSGYRRRRPRSLVPIPRGSGKTPGARA